MCVLAALQIRLGCNLGVAVPPGYQSGGPPEPVASAGPEPGQACHSPDALRGLHDSAASQAEVWLRRFPC